MVSVLALALNLEGNVNMFETVNLIQYAIIIGTVIIASYQAYNLGIRVGVQVSIQNLEEAKIIELDKKGNITSAVCPICAATDAILKRHNM